MKLNIDRQLRPSTETSWVVSYDGKTIPRWRTAAILKSVISPYLSEKKSSDINEIWYTAADFRTGWTSRDQKWKSCIGQTPSSTERISLLTKVVTLSLSLFKLFPSRLSWVVGADVVRGLGWVHYFAGLGWAGEKDRVWSVSFHSLIECSYIFNADVHMKRLIT